MEAVAESIKAFGFRQPIVVDENHVIIAGHARYFAAIRIGLDKVPVHVDKELTPEPMIVFSGRSRSCTDRLTKQRKANTGNTGDVWFLDSNGITAMYQRGVWLYQKFHSLADVRALAHWFIGPEFEIIDDDDPRKSEIEASSWAAVGTKAVEPPVEDILNALMFEFNLPLPEGQRYGRGPRVSKAWQESIPFSGRNTLEGRAH